MSPFARTRMRTRVFVPLALLVGAVTGCGGRSPTTNSPPDARLAVGGSEILYGPGIEPAEAQKVSAVLVRDKYFGDRPGTVQLRYHDRRYQARCVVPAGVESAPDTRRWRVLGEALSKEAFRGAPVDVELCDEGLKTLRTVAYQPLRPDLPVAITFRPSVGGGSLVARYRNTSNRYLSVAVALTDSTRQRYKEVTLALGPNQTVEHGWLEGWDYMSGELIAVSHADYEPLDMTVP